MRSTSARISALGRLAIAEAEGDVVADGQVGEEGVALEDGVDLALVGRQVGDVAAVEEDAAGVGLLEAGGQAQHGRLAAAARAEEGEELALPEPEGDVVDGPDGAEPLGDAAEFEEACSKPLHYRRRDLVFTRFTWLREDGRPYCGTSRPVDC